MLLHSLLQLSLTFKDSFYLGRFESSHCFVGSYLWMKVCCYHTGRYEKIRRLTQTSSQPDIGVKCGTLKNNTHVMVEGDIQIQNCVVMLENKHNGASVDVDAEVDILIVHVKGDKSGEKMREIGRKGFTISLLVLCRRKEESTRFLFFN